MSSHTYFPDDGSAVIQGDREASFTLKGGVNLYGGFVGTEMHRFQAEPEDNITILSGAIWAEKIYWSLHVVTVLGSATIDGFAVTKGNANGDASPFNRGAGILATNALSNLVIRRCSFTNNTASNGGAIFVLPPSPVSVIDCTFTGNSASFGVAIYGTTTATNCTFSGNSGERGAIYGIATVVNCIFSENSCTAIEGTTTATNSIFSGHSRGAIYGTTNATNCMFLDNSGGAIRGNTIATNCTFSGNSVPINHGGAINGNTTATNCTFSGNSAGYAGYGGAIMGTTTAINCEFSGNSSGSNGGAIYGTTYATNCIFSGNTGGSGAAIYGTTTATNCIFSGNSSTGNGGAIWGWTTTVTNCTLINNFAMATNRRGGAIYSAVTCLIFNNIIWHSSPQGQSNLIYISSEASLRNADSDFPSPLNQAKNLIKGGMSSITVGAGGVLSLGDTSVTILSSDPVFVSPGNAAGVDGIWGTADDGLRLMHGSPGIDMGLARYLPKDTRDLDQDGDSEELIPVDLAGFTRIQGAAPDLGAYETGIDFPPIVIGAEPESMTVAIGLPAYFAIQAAGYDLSYQWYLGQSGDVSQPLQNETMSFFTTQPLDATVRYWVRVSNGAGFMDSQTATATILPVKISSQPQSAIIAKGSTANLSVKAQGQGLQFQWYHGISGDTSQPIAGANSPTFRTQVIAEHTEFWVRITGLHGIANSDTALIRVTEDMLAAALFAGSNLFYTTGGDAEWFVQKEETHSEGDALRSGTIMDNQITYVETTVETAGTLTFWWRVSSQSGGDFLRFYVNGIEQTGNISGTTGSWAQRAITVASAGPHTFRWSYTKNASTNTGSDCGWLDDVLWTPKLITTQPDEDKILIGTSSHMTVGTQGSGLTYQWYEGDSGAMYDPIPGADGPHFITAALDANQKYWVKVGNGVGFEYSQTVMIRVYQPDAAIAVSLGADEEIAFFTWGAQPWVVQMETTFDGSHAMRSGTIDHAQTSVLEAVVSGPGQLNFWWKVSSELGYDFLRFSIDGVQQFGISGEIDWQQSTYQLTGNGPHRLRWDYRKDETKTSGSDHGWLDTVVWTPAEPTMSYSSWASAHNLSGDDALKTASPANDGVPNLMKYALGLAPEEPAFSPTDGANPGLPAMTMDDDFMNFVFIKDTAKTEISYTVETCGDLDTWVAVTEGIIETPLEGTEVRVTVLLPRLGRQFVRLKVSE